MRKVYSILLVLTFCVAVGAESKSWVRIHIKDPKDVENLIRAGIDDIATVNFKKLYVEAIVPRSKLQILEKYTYDMIDPDLTETWKRWIRDGILIDFGPYYTYSEATLLLDSLHMLYSSITTEKISIGTSWEGRDIWAMKISDNPQIDEDEPAALYTGVHHAREPIGCTIVLEFARYLGENYGTDPTVTWLVNNREIWIVPIVNPDGYVYNESSDGYWRKNKRDNNNNGYFEEFYDGVDLNRNYGYMWGYDNVGSSPDPSSQIYRGPSPFSEPEVAAIRELTDSIEPVIALNYHSYSNYLLFPWGYDYYYTPDDSIFRAMAEIMTSASGYTIGTPWELLYTANGVSDDWMYGEQSEKPKVFAFTPEVGEAFWQPDINTINEQIAENLPMNLYVAKAVGLYLERSGIALRDQFGDYIPNPGDSLWIVITLRNLSPAEAGYNLNGALVSESSDVSVIDGIAPFGVVGPFPGGYTSNSSDSFLIYVDPSFPAHSTAHLTLTVTGNGSFEEDIPIDIYIGGEAGFFDDVETGVGGWTHGGTGDLWHITEHRAYSPTHSWYCGVEGSWQYNNNMNCWLMTPDIVLYPQSRLVFRTYYNLETGYDYGYVEVSTDGGSTWDVIETFNGTSGGWVRVEKDLSSYSGVVKIRFRLNSDTYVVEEGWYIDDISVEPLLYPDISVYPDSLYEAVVGGGTSEDTLYIENLGDYDLEFSIVAVPQGVRLKSGERRIVRISRVEPRKEEPDLYKGKPVVKGSGGPDGFGYVWIDSDEPGGPEFSWVDIVGVGTPLYLGDDDYEQVTLPWSFSFYGVGKTWVKISSNGYLTFGVDGTDYSNDPIPDPTDPNDMIAPFWDDLNPSSGGQVYYYYDSVNDRFIVEWYQVPHYYYGGPYTFEVILYPDGRVLYQYLSMVSRLDEATIGIENVDGSDGLEVVYNANYVHDSLAVRISGGVEWLGVDPVSGVVEPGGEVMVRVMYDASSLSEGGYIADLLVVSNDPDESSVRVPVVMDVISYISGDCNGDGEVNTADLSYLANYLYSGGPTPSPLLAGDVNGDCEVNSADLSYLANYLYFGGPPPQYCNQSFKGKQTMFRKINLKRKELR